MKKKSNFSHRLCYVLATISLLAIGSCQKTEVPASAVSTEMNTQKHFMAIQNAIQIAIAIPDGVIDGKTVKRSLKDVIVAEDKTIQNSKAILYIVNYKEGGYAVISADSRLGPVLAFVPQGEGLVKGQEIPNGLFGWFMGMKGQIEKMRLSNIELAPKANTNLVPKLKLHWSE